MTPRYQDASALRRALEDRLRQQSADLGHDLTRQRRLVAFDRLAARLSADPTSNWILKGGAVLEFRLRDRARMTKNLDLATRLDVAARGDELAHTDLLPLPNTLAFTRDYGDRPNTRVNEPLYARILT